MLSAMRSSSSSGGTGSEVAIASVGDEDVTVNEYAQTYRGEINRLTRTFGRQVTQEEASIFGLDQNVITQTLAGATLDGEAKRQEISVGDEVVHERLQRDPNFLDLTNYKETLRRNNITPREYEDNIRSQATRQLVSAAVGGGVAVGDTVPNAILRFVGEKRGLSFLRLDPTALETPVAAPTDTDLAAYFEPNKENYRRPETREVTYVALRESDLTFAEDVSEEDIAAEYEARKAEFSRPAMVSVDRIVFPSPEDASAALTQIQSDETDFDAVAEARGLSLADIELGEVTPNELAADARTPLFEATEPGVLGPFKSDLGPALYRLNAILPASITELADVRDDIAKGLAQDIAVDRLANAADEIDDLIASGATLEEVAEATAMSLSTLEFDPDNVQGISAESNFRREVLEAEVDESRDLQDLQDGGLFALRVDSIKEPHIPPLADLKERVTADWTKAKTLESLQVMAENLEKRLKADETLADIAAELNLTVVTPDPLERTGTIEGAPPELLSKVFEGSNGESLIVDDGENAYIGVIGDLVPIDLLSSDSDALREQITESLQSSTAQDMVTYFTLGLQDREGVNVNLGVVQSVIGQIHNY